MHSKSCQIRQENILLRCRGSSHMPLRCSLIMSYCKARWLFPMSIFINDVKIRLYLWIWPQQLLWKSKVESLISNAASFRVTGVSLQRWHFIYSADAFDLRAPRRIEGHVRRTRYLFTDHHVLNPVRWISATVFHFCSLSFPCTGGGDGKSVIQFGWLLLAMVSQPRQSIRKCRLVRNLAGCAEWILHTDLFLGLFFLFLKKYYIRQHNSCV